MLDQFHQLSDLVILIFVVSVCAGSAFASPFIGRALGLRSNKERDGTAFDAYKAVMAIAGVVLAFSLVQADSNLRSTQAIVRRESDAIVKADRSLLRFGDPAVLQVRPLLDAFARSQLRDEWPALVDKGRNLTTESRYSDLSRAVRGIEPQSRREETIYAEMIKALDDISDERDAIIDAASAQLAVFFWIVSCSFLVLGLVLGCLTEASISRATALSGTAAGIGLLMSFVAIVDQPFQGETSVKPTPIAGALVLDSNRR
jgi:hypothetical protein